MAFVRNGSSVRVDGDGRVNLTDMWQAEGSPADKKPAAWRRRDDATSFIEDLVSALNVRQEHILRADRGKGGSTWAHWQIAMAYAKHLSNEFHREVNEAYLKWKQEERDPGIKMTRAVAAYKKMGRTDEWIDKRLRGIVHRKQLTDTMGDHNCVRRGRDNPFAEASRSVALGATGKTPREYKADKGVRQSAQTRDLYSDEELVATDLIEICAARGIREHRADGNEQCVAVVRKVSQTIGAALSSLRLSG